MKFKEGNKIRYGQDFFQHRGVPHDVDFHVKSFGNGRFELTAKGYGDLKDYGNGSLIVWGLNKAQKERMEKIG